MAKKISKERLQAMRILELEHDVQYCKGRANSALEKNKELEQTLKEFERANSDLSYFKREAKRLWNEWIEADKGRIDPSYDSNSSALPRECIVYMKEPAFAKWHPATFQQLMNLMHDYMQ